jgi:VWFA-related protein
MARLLEGSCFLIKGACFLIFVIAIDTAPQQPATSASPAPQTSPSVPGAQQKAPVYETATVLKAVTRLVVVDVVATDKKGEVVTDLERADFTVLEDGKEQQIRVFNFQQPAVAAAGSTTPAVSPPVLKLPDNVFTNVPKYNVNSALNVLLLDALNTTAPHQAYVRAEMIKYLAKMPQGRPVAIYTLGSKLTLLHDFTSDPETLKEVVKKLTGKISSLLDNPAGGPDQELLPAGAADSGLVPASMLQSMMQFEQERTAFQTDLRVTYTLNALNAISRSLSGYPGRKNLIWISEAFPLSIDPNMELTGDIFAGTRNYGQQIAAAADALIDAQVAVYPVDARGLMPPSMFDASTTGRDKFGRAMNGPRMGTAISNESAQLQAVHGTMQDMAERTGGKAFYNRNDIDGVVGKSIEDGSTYYTLAYYPENKDWNGKFRKIYVKVSRSGIKLRYRLGYYAVDPKAFAEQNKKQQATFFGEALNPDTPVSTGLKFQAEVVPPSDKTQNRVLVNFALDPQAISFEDEKDGFQHATVDCVVQAYSAKGKFIRTEASTVNASLKPETYRRLMQSAFPCKQSIDLPAGNYYLRLGVRDDRTGLMGTANGKVTVAQPPEGAPVAPHGEEKKP